MSFIYVLRLTNGKFYVGKTNNVQKRFDEHINGQGSLWTRKYKPLEIIEIIPKVSDFDENKFTKEYMSRYGIENVRGGSHVQETFSKEQLLFLQQEIWGATDKCLKCGSNDHFANVCSKIDEEEEEEYCFRCGRKFCHSTIKCIEKTNIFGDSISFSNVTPFSDETTIKCFKCGKYGHWINECFSINTKNV